MEDNLQIITLEAGADLSAKQYFFVSVAADGQVDPTGDGARADGILQNDPAAPGRPASVAIAGVSRVVCGAAVTRGALVASDASGKCVDAAQNDEIAGIALDTGSGDGAIIRVKLALSGRAPKP